MPNTVLFNNNLSIDDYKKYLEDYKDYLRDDGEVSEDSIKSLDIYDEPFHVWCNDQLEWDYDDLKNNFRDITLTKTIIIFADLGLWFGRRTGAKIIGYKLMNCFVCDEDYVSWELDRYNLVSTQIHHDGTNYLTYRMVKDDRYIQLLMDKAYSGTLTKRDITRYTESLKPTIQLLME